LFVRLGIYPPRTKLAASNFARRFIGVQCKESHILGNFAPPEAQNRLLFLFVCLFARLQLYPPRIKPAVAASNFAWRFIGVQGRESYILENYASPEAQNRTNRPTRGHARRCNISREVKSASVDRMGEEIAFENGRISDFQGLVTLTLDRVILHTVMHRSSTSTCILNFCEIEVNVCGRTDVWTDSLDKLFGRLGGPFSVA